MQNKQFHLLTIIFTRSIANLQMLQLTQKNITSMTLLYHRKSTDTIYFDNQG